MKMHIDDIKHALKEVIVKEVQLPIRPDEIKSDAPLFGEGLGLDSVEALAIASGIEQRFGVVIEDMEGIQETFRSVDTLSIFVEKLLSQKESKS